MLICLIFVKVGQGIEYVITEKCGRIFKSINSASFPKVMRIFFSHLASSQTTRKVTKLRGWSKFSEAKISLRIEQIEAVEAVKF